MKGADISPKLTLRSTKSKTFWENSPLFSLRSACSICSFYKSHKTLPLSVFFHWGKCHTPARGMKNRNSYYIINDMVKC